MEFKSQICTTKEQSDRLLELGLNPETADMHYFRTVDFEGMETWLESVIPYERIKFNADFVGEIQLVEDNITSAWSLHRLIELCPEYINIDGYADTTYWFKLYKLDNKIIYENDYDRWIYLGDGDTLFDTLIDCIEWLISNKHFKQDFLNK